MKANIGTVDRIIRIAAAIILVLMYVFNVVSGVWGGVFLILAALLLITSLISVCPLYFPFGISTCKKEQKA